ncbi:acetylglutamate kinase [Shewanella waksmanii]|uniref:acetylglutamate kinase n=1 Tax=Shewanella waksmanii TaxID=213783 RepID=UPI000491784B
MSAMKQVLVLKVGGALLQSEAGMAQLMTTAGKIIAAGTQLILVHGGGCLVDEQLAANGMSSEKLDGLRVSLAEHMPIVVGALAGTANKMLQAAAAKAGVTSVGLSLADANMVKATIKDPRLGYVGEVSANDPSLLTYLLQQSWMPIISSIAIDANGAQLNVNADQAASVLAKLVGGQLVLLSDVPGVLNAEGELVNQLTLQQAEQLTQEGVIAKGMKVKVQAAFDVAQATGQTVQVASWKDSEQLMLLAQGECVGTQILP